MFKRKLQMHITSNEQRIIAEALIDMKNFLHSQGRYTDCVDELIIRVINICIIINKTGKNTSESDIY